jgi:hypothetical protein
VQGSLHRNGLDRIQVIVILDGAHSGHFRDRVISVSGPSLEMEIPTV